MLINRLHGELFGTKSWEGSFQPIPISSIILNGAESCFCRFGDTANTTSPYTLTNSIPCPFNHHLFISNFFNTSHGILRRYKINISNSLVPSVDIWWSSTRSLFRGFGLVWRGQRWFERKNRRWLQLVVRMNPI